MTDFNHIYMGSLVKRAQQKDSDAFADLYVLTYKHIYQYSYRYLKNKDAAQDAVQDIYILALKNINNLKDTSLFVAWLNQIAFHVCYDICKKNNNQYGESSSELLELFPDEYEAHNPERSAVKADQYRLLQCAIKRLPFNEQQAIVLKYYNEMKLEDIARSMQCSRSSVKRYLLNAKEHLLQFLQSGNYSCEEGDS